MCLSFACCRPRAHAHFRLCQALRIINHRHWRLIQHPHCTSSCCGSQQEVRFGFQTGTAAFIANRAVWTLQRTWWNENHSSAVEPTHRLPNAHTRAATVHRKPYDTAHYLWHVHSTYQQVHTPNCICCTWPQCGNTWRRDGFVRAGAHTSHT